MLYTAYMYLISYRYEKLQQANATLTAFNDYSSTMYNTLFKDFDKYTKLMKEMKKDLNLIFRKIRYDLFYESNMTKIFEIKIERKISR